MSNNYADYRENIKSGDLIVQGILKRVTVTEVALEVVRLVTKSPYVHTGIAWVVGDRAFVIEAIYPKVVITPLSKYDNFYHLPLNIEWSDNYTSFLLEHVGLKYGFMDIVHMEFGIGEDNPNTVFCSELAAEFYMKIGYISIPDDDLTPKQIIDILISASGKELVQVITPYGDT